MSDNNIEQRLTETSQTCLEAYTKWAQNRKDSDAREALQDAVHELRKVASRLEIEIALSERDEQTRKNIPIPSHRSHKGRKKQDQDNGQGNNNDDLPDFIKGGDNDGQNNGGDNKPKRGRKPGGKTTGTLRSRKKAGNDGNDNNNSQENG